MQLEEYSDFVSADEIRLRGTRVPVEAVLFEYFAGDGVPMANVLTAKQIEQAFREEKVVFGQPAASPTHASSAALAKSTRFRT